MFTIRANSDYTDILFKSDYHERLENRIKKSPEFYEEVMADREANYCSQASFIPSGPIDELLPGTYYLTSIDEKWRREYSRVPYKAKTLKVTPSAMISYSSTTSKLFELSKI